MALLSHLGLGFGVATQGINLLYAFIGAMLGTLIGVLPGIGPVATIAMLLPTTYALQPVSALIMLAGIYYGAQYGGGATATPPKTPPRTPPAATSLDRAHIRRKEAGAAAARTAPLGDLLS